MAAHAAITASLWSIAAVVLLRWRAREVCSWGPLLRKAVDFGARDATWGIISSCQTAEEAARCAFWPRLAAFGSAACWLAVVRH